MRLKRSTVAKSFNTLLVAGFAAALSVAGCGNSGDSGTGGTGGAGGRSDAGVPPGTGGSVPLPGTGGSAPDSGTVVPDAPVIVSDAPVNLDGGADAATGPEVNRPGDAQLGADASDVATDVATATDTRPSVDASAEALGGGSCLNGKWAKEVDVTSLTGLSADKDGNLFVAMSLYPSNANIDLGAGALTSAGGADLVIAKLDPATGKAGWSKVFGDSSDQLAGTLAVAKSGQVGVQGTFMGEMAIKDTIKNPATDPIDFVAAVDASGTGLWAKAIDTKQGSIRAIAASAAQDAFAICGYTMGAATDLVPAATASADQLEDVIVAKLNATTGAVLWSRQINSPGQQVCSAIAMDAAGNVFIGGSYNGATDLGSGALSPAPGAAAMAIFVAKLDGATGSTLAAKGWGNTNRKQQVYALALDGAGNLAMGGSLRGTVTFGSTTLSPGVPAVDAGTSTTNKTDAFAVKLDSSLSVLWARNWGDEADQSIHALTFDSKGDLVVGGTLIGTIDMGNGSKLVSATGADSYLNPQADAFWMKISGIDGAPVCGQRYGDTYAQEVDLLAMGKNDTVTMSGFYKGSIDLGLGTPFFAGVPGISSSSYTYSYLLQLAP